MVLLSGRYKKGAVGKTKVYQTAYQTYVWILRNQKYLRRKLDDAIHDMEAGRMQTIEETRKEIDKI